MDAFPCSRHPDVETRLRCSACETAICPDCWVEAAVGYRCPNCARARGDALGGRSDAVTGRLGAGRRTGPGARAGAAPSLSIARAVAVGTLGAIVGGLLLGPVLQQGTLFLISSGAIGWGVARAVFWGAHEVSTPLTRALALGFAGGTAAVGLLTAGAADAAAGALFLAYPAALYGGWIAVRRR